LFVSFAVLWLELRAFTFLFFSYIFLFVLAPYPHGAFTLSHSTSLIFFVIGFFEIGSGELFAWAGFEL
jgi:hypothetical protein